MHPADDSAPADAVLARAHPRHGWIGMAGHWPAGLSGILAHLRAEPDASPFAIAELVARADTVGLTPGDLDAQEVDWLILVEDDVVHVDALRPDPSGRTGRVATLSRAPVAA